MSGLSAAMSIGRLSASRVLELPRGLTTGGAAADDTWPRQLAALVAAYHAGTPVLFGWHRPGAAMPVEVFAAGGVGGDPDPRGLTPLSLPPGALGRAYPDGALLQILRGVPAWIRVAVRTDGLVAERQPQAGHARPTLDESLLHVWRSGFAWLVLAEPIPPSERVGEAAPIEAEKRPAQFRAPATAAPRQRRSRKSHDGQWIGRWRVWLLAGGDSPSAAAAIAGLVSLSANPANHEWTLRPRDAASDFDTAIAEPADLIDSLMLAKLAVTPVNGVPGPRFAMRSEFDVTPEPTGLGLGIGGGFEIGATLDRALTPVGPFRLPLESLNRHTFVCGATGAGKSQTVRRLLEGATVPWLVVEPAKAEYRQMADRVGSSNVIVIRPGDPDAPPAGFNPLRPADGFPLQTHLDLTRSLFLAAFKADEPFPQVLVAALTRCYEDLGWDLALNEPRVAKSRPRYPTLGDLLRTAEQVVDQIGYGREVTDNVRGFIRVRLSGLRLGTTGRFFEAGHPLDFAALLRHNVVFEIQDVGDDRDKAFLMGGLIIQLTEHLRMAGRRDPELLKRRGLHHLSVFEEAHRLLRRTDEHGPVAHAVELIAALLAEIRAYGEGLVIVEQIPSKLVPDVMKNTAIKIMHRLPAADDRRAVGATINLTERQSQFLVTVPPGVAAVFTDGMDNPVLVRMPDGSIRERGGRTPTGPIDAVIGRRSASCGGQCAATPCTLRDMRVAQRLTEDEPWLKAWGELAVLGHLTGWPIPALKAHHLRTLIDLSERTRQCALSHLVDEAIATRSTVLGKAADPAAMATHVVAAMMGMCRGTFDCAAEEPEFLSSAAQRRVVALGTPSPSALELALGATFGTSDWLERVDRLLMDDFARCQWPRRYLSGDEKEALPEPSGLYI